MIQEKYNFTDGGLAFDKSFGDKNRKPVPESGFKVGECYVVRSENFINPIECKLLKIYDHSALVGIIKTNHKADFLKSVELEGKTVVNFKNFQYELKKEK